MLYIKKVCLNVPFLIKFLFRKPFTCLSRAKGVNSEVNWQIQPESFRSKLDGPKWWKSTILKVDDLEPWKIILINLYGLGRWSTVIRGNVKFILSSHCEQPKDKVDGHSAISGWSKIIDLKVHDLSKWTVEGSVPALILSFPVIIIKTNQLRKIHLKHSQKAHHPHDISFRNWFHDNFFSCFGHLNKYCFYWKPHGRLVIRWESCGGA